MPTFDHGVSNSGLHTAALPFLRALGRPFADALFAAITSPAALCGKTDIGYFPFVNGLCIYYMRMCRRCQVVFAKKHAKMEFYSQIASICAHSSSEKCVLRSAPRLSRICAGFDAPTSTDVTMPSRSTHSNAISASV